MSSGSTCIANQPWQNWAGTLDNTPACTFYPESESDLVAIVNQARQDGKTVRAVGSGHSWSPGAVTPDYLVVGNKMTQATASAVPDPQNPGQQLLLLTVQPGTTQGAAAQVAAAFSPAMTFPTLGVIPSITLGGFIANGCHGTGWTQPTVVDLVYGMRVVQADGTVAVYSEADTPELMPLVRCNLGGFGLISSITFKMVPMFNLSVVNTSLPMSQVVDRNDPTVLQGIVTAHPYVEIFWFPFNDEVWLKYYDLTTDPPSRTPIQEAWNQIFQYLSTEAGGWILDKLSEHPEATPDVCKFLYQMAKLTMGNYVAQAPGAFLYQSESFPVTDCELAIPIAGGTDFSAVNQAWYEIVDGVYAQAKKNDYPLNVSAHARFLQNSQTLMSPVYAGTGSSDHNCYIEFLSYQPQAQPLGQQRLADYEAFVSLVAQQWMALGGRPHWGKLIQNIPGIFPYVYQAFGGGQPGGNLTQYAALRQQLDPGGMFLNTYLEEILSGNSIGG
jgi:FAD/FMN-containing dehydrogenase